VNAGESAARIVLGVAASVFAAVVIGLSGWTLKKLSDLSIEVAREEQDVHWIKDLLYRKLRDMPLKDDDK